MNINKLVEIISGWIDHVLDAYKDYSALDLSSITHQGGTPWDITRREYGIGSIIPNKLIREHYVRRLEESD